MLYNILKVLGACMMIMAYFGGFIIAIGICMWISEKINLHFYKQRMEIAEKYVRSIYNSDRNSSRINIDIDDIRK